MLGVEAEVVEVAPVESTLSAEAEEVVETKLISEAQTKKQEKKKKYDPSLRVANVMQYVNHPETGEPLLSEERICLVVSKYKVIKRWAYILHDQDTKDDGSLKPPHWHIVLSIPDKIKLSSVASWFGIEPQYVEIPKGRNAFRDCVAYLTHQGTPDKYQYNDESVHANFDWKAYVEAAGNVAERLLLDSWLNDVSGHGKTLKACSLENPALFVRSLGRLRDARGWYLRKVAPMPLLRQNILITGAGGSGKTVLAYALAKELIDPESQLDPEEIYFTVGEGGSAFTHYDGQPVVIWDDARMGGKKGLLQRFGRETLLKLMDTHPSRMSTDVKYSDTCLTNAYNIFTTPGEPKDFIEALVDKEQDPETGQWHNKEDLGQAYRRIPLVFIVTADQVRMMINERYWTSNDKVPWSSLYLHCAISGSISKVQASRSVLGDECADKAICKLVRTCGGEMRKLSSSKAKATEEECSALRQEVDSEFGEMCYGADLRAKLEFYNDAYDAACEACRAYGNIIFGPYYYRQRENGEALTEAEIDDARDCYYSYKEIADIIEKHCKEINRQLEGSLKS